MSEDQKFKVGDTVRLRSGGPLMTVNRLVPMADGTHEVATVWFDSQNKEAGGRYKMEVLMLDDGAPRIG